jgi:hypothetical protein
VYKIIDLASFVKKKNTTFLICIILLLAIIHPIKVYASCDGILGPAYFSLYKNMSATFSSFMDADTKQRYKVEWFLGRKLLGAVIKNAGESFTLKGPEFSGQTFSITGFHQKGREWILSRYKIFPDPDGSLQVRFDDHACDNSYINSPDLKIIVRIQSN